MTDEIPEFEVGDEFDLDELPDNEMNPTGESLEWVGDETLALATEDGQLVEFWWSGVEVTDVKYVTDDGDVVNEKPQ